MFTEYLIYLALAWFHPFWIVVLNSDSVHGKLTLRGRFAQDQSTRKFGVRMKLHVWSDTTLTTLDFTRVQGCVGIKRLICTIKVQCLNTNLRCFPISFY